MRTLFLGNLRLGICKDELGNVAEIFHPNIGYPQHCHKLMMGAYADGNLSWLNQGWNIRQKYLENTNISKEKATGHGLEITQTEFVNPSRDVYARRIGVKNLENRARDVSLFSYHDLHIHEYTLGETALFDPERHAMIHFKHDHYFLFASEPKFDMFSCGKKEWNQMEGTFKDAEDGRLSGNMVENGPVDSCLGWNFGKMEPAASREISLYLIVGNSFHDVNGTLEVVRKLGMDALQNETGSHWEKALSLVKRNPLKLKSSLMKQYYRSILTIHLAFNKNGAIIASPDTSISRFGGDTYCYSWPRDGSWIAIALDNAGYHELARRFFMFVKNLASDDGYFYHKYYPTGLLGSTWHPIPFIQIDQTGIVLYALENHISHTNDSKLLKECYPMVKRAAEFLVSFRDNETKLPLPSFDLWEERKAVNTYSASAVFAGLQSAAILAGKTGEGKDAVRWSQAANEVKAGILKYLFDAQLGRFLKSVSPRDQNVDASLMAVLFYGVLPAADFRVKKTAEAIDEKLLNMNVGGYARYEGDSYHGRENPWLITTSFMVQYYMSLGKKHKAEELLDWMAGQEMPTDLLPEQVSSDDRTPLSVSPLIWSHAAFVWAVEKFANSKQS